MSGLSQVFANHKASPSLVPMIPVNKHITESPVLNGWPIPSGNSKMQTVSISGRLRSASFAEKEGILDVHQKGIIKDLIISGDERVVHAMDAYDGGNKKELKELLNSGLLNKLSKSNIDLLDKEDLDISFLNMGGHSSKNIMPKEAMFSLDDVSFTANTPANGPFPDPPTPGPHFMSMNSINANFPDPSQYSPALHGYSAAVRIRSPAMGGRSPGMHPMAWNRSPGMHPMHMSYQSPGIHGMSPNGFGGFPDDYTNFNFDGNSHVFDERLGGVVNGGDLANVSLPRMVMPMPSPMQKPVDVAQKKKKKKKKKNARQTKAKTSNAKPVKKKKKAVPLASVVTVTKKKKPKKKKKKKASQKIEIPVMETKIPTVGAYSPRSRRKRIERFLKKRQQRVWTKRVKYDVRKNFADSRLRVKGRFVKKEDEELLRELMNMA